MMNTYAQAGEDIILHNIFSKKLGYSNPGFFVDVGAHHPTEFSNTMLLYEKGWRGINIDAHRSFEKEFELTRPEDTNIVAAVSDRPKKLIYHVLEKSPWANSLSEKFLVQNNSMDKVTASSPVDALPLKDILKEHLPENKKIDLLCVDVEGLEDEVIRSNDWKKYRPRVIAIDLPGESITSLHKSFVFQFLENNFYTAVSKTYVDDNSGNIFFIDQL